MRAKSGSERWKVELFWTAIIASIAAVLLFCTPANGQCPGGACPPRRDGGVTANIRAPGVRVDVAKRPTPAWRYERPTGHRAAVVRIYCQDDVRTRSIGSGVLVRWGKRIVVVTARHVVQDAKRVVVRVVTGKTYRARVLKVDAAWDCAVLELNERPEGVAAAEFEFGSAALFRDGDRLESCGYGSDGKLASNNGLFQGYRRRAAAKNGPDDWVVLSGYARQGDSGGPIFNSRGRVVGILWGTDGQTVVGVQAGRLHVLMSEAEKYMQQALADSELNLVPVVFPQQRTPTPPAECVPGDDGSCDCDQTARGQVAPLLPWRGDAQRRDDSQDQRIDALIGAIERDRVAREQGPAIDVEVSPQRPPEPEIATAEPSPLGIVLCLLAAGACGIVLFYVAGKN